MILVIAAAICGLIVLVVVSLCIAAKAGDEAVQMNDRTSPRADGAREPTIIFREPAIANLDYRLHPRPTRRRGASKPRRPWPVVWEAVSALLQALNARDPRIGRHAAGVAQFARDIARNTGMSDVDCELAYTAGLVHDIGHFALSDRVHDRGSRLTDEDWVAIWRHPEIGAKLLDDLGAPEQLVEIVRAHHERVDGRGYPHGLGAEQIPEIAKVVAVAEVYDTLTASDTYRTPMSSFEALRELRRVADTQLDGGYVEALASELSVGRIRPRSASALT